MLAASTPSCNCRVSGRHRPSYTGGRGRQNARWFDTGLDICTDPKAPTGIGAFVKPLSLRADITAKRTRVQIITNSPASVPAFRRRIVAISRLLARYLYVLYRKVHASEKGYLRSHYLPFESTPASLLRECQSDIRTACSRIGQRIDKLPFRWISPVGPCYERDAKGNLIPNMRTRSCMSDMQSFETQHPKATEFDWEVFRIGWEAGARWCDGTQLATQTLCESDREENTCNPPDRAIIGH